MSLTAAEIEAVVRSSRPSRCASTRCGSTPSGRSRSSCSGARGPARLLLSAEPDVTRLHAVARARRAPAAPFPFQQVLRRELEGARVAAIEALPGDRVVALRLEAPRGPLRLVAELTGRHGNLFLVGRDGIIRASAGRNLSQRRSLVAGEPYVAPAPPPRGGAPPGASFRSARRSRSPPPSRRATRRSRRSGSSPRAAAGSASRSAPGSPARAARSRSSPTRRRASAAEADRRAADLLEAEPPGGAARRGAR